MTEGLKATVSIGGSFQYGPLAATPTYAATSRGRDGQTTTGANAIVWSLEALGVSAIFGIPGGNVMPLYDALMDSSTIRHILTRHEQGAGHAAEGYAAASRRVGVTIATSGPGASNLITAIADAYMSSIPLLIITGQVPSGVIGTDAFQEADIIGMTTPITKHSFLVTAAEEIASTIAKAHLIASTGRRGPVLVDITKDAQQALVRFEWPTELHLPGYKPKPAAHKRQLRVAAELIRKSERPVLYIGRGVIRADATDQLRQFVQLTGIPVVTAPNARGAFPEADERHIGVSGTNLARLALEASDLVIAIAADFDKSPTRDPALFAPKAKLIHADVDPMEVTKVRVPDVPIVGDVKHVIHALSKFFPDRDREKDGFILRQRRPTDFHEGVTPSRDPDNGLLSPQYVLERIGALTGQEGIYALGAGQYGASSHVIECNHAESWLTSVTPGYGVPAAMGAKVARPNRQVWAIDSDSCFQMTNQELATCTVNQIPIKVAILNTGKVSRTQEMSTNLGQTSSCPTFPSPDFVKLADAFGALAIRVSLPEEVDAAIKLALDTNDRTVVIDFVVSPKAHG